jgi:hypothetical protein
MLAAAKRNTTRRLIATSSPHRRRNDTRSASYSLSGRTEYRVGAGRLVEWLKG